jgi:hypothetical protein
VVVRNQKTPFSCVASRRGYDRRSSKGFFFADQDRTPRVSGGPRWAAGKETSAREYHPLRAAQRSRATAKALALLGGLRSSVIESGVKRSLVEAP